MTKFQIATNPYPLSIDSIFEPPPTDMDLACGHITFVGGEEATARRLVSTQHDGTVVLGVNDTNPNRES